MNAQARRMPAALLSLLVASVGGAGCMVDAFDEVHESQQAIGEGDCIQADPDDVMHLSGTPDPLDPPPIPPHSISPASYDNPDCDKAWVVEIENFLFEEPALAVVLGVEYNGPRRPGLLNNLIPSSTAPNKAACDAIVMRAVRWERGGLSRKLDDITSRASWVVTGDPPFPGQPPPGVCFVPSRIGLPARGPRFLSDTLAVGVQRSGGTLGVVVAAAPAS